MKDTKTDTIEELAMIPETMSRNLPTMVRNELSKMSAQRQQEFVEEYGRKARSTSKAFLLWLIGFHYAYLRKWGLLAIFWVFAGGLLAWAIVDASRMTRMVRDYNKNVAIDVLKDMKAIVGG